MFSPLILICSLMSNDCQTVAAPVFSTNEQCVAAVEAHIKQMTLPPQLFIFGWTCFEWDQPA